MSVVFIFHSAIHEIQSMTCQMQWKLGVQRVLSLISLQWDVRELILIIYDMIMHKHNTRKVMKCQAPRRGHSNLRSLTHLLHNHQVSFLPCIVVESGESMVKRNELSLSLRTLI